MIPCTYIGLHPPKKKTERPAHAQGAIHTHSATHTHSNVRVTTAASETEGVAAVSWIESLMIRRPFGSIDPNSIRETELHKESRRRHSRGERETLHSPQLDRERDPARQKSIDPNSIRETELHKESRRRHSRGERESLHSPAA